ncbi:hypothetical protein BDZ45DRAFT_683099 [Acephala macrosclerotiorum]|nr:hypothetical protein BDZ45DRAFT_683099 [Acephala macrosclerotiorum]
MSHPPHKQQEGPPVTPRHPSTLFDALDKVGRVRGSSATPEPTKTPITNLDQAKAREELFQRLRDMPSEEAFSTKASNLPAYLLGLHNRNSSDESGSSEGGAALISTQKPPSMDELAVEFQGRLNTLIDRINSSNMPTTARDILVSEVTSIGNDFRDQEKRLLREIERIMSERDHFESRLRDTANQLRIAKAERDKNRNDYQDLFLAMEELRAKSRKSEAALAEAKSHFAQETEKLNLKLRHQDEQLKGKRALWLNSNPGSSARRSAMTAIRDPFESPSAPNVSFDTINTSFGSGNMGDMLSPTTSSPYTSFDSHISLGGPPPKMNVRAVSTPQSLRHRGTMPAGTPSGATIGLASRNNRHNFPQHLPRGGGKSHSTMATMGDTPPKPKYDPNSYLSVDSLNLNARGLTHFIDEEDSDLAPEFREALCYLYVVIEGWAREYCNLPNPDGDQKVMKNNPEVWEFLMNCTYPTKRQDAHVHAVALMNDRTSRYWFIMRMICQHIFVEMVTLKGWYGFSEECNEKLNQIAVKFSERGLQNEARQKLIDQRVRVIEEIKNGINFQDWRSEQLSYHTKILRGLVSHFLNDDSDRLAAGRDLGVLTIEAWKMSTKMNSAPVSFQIYFPETNGKFSATSMSAKDRYDIDGMALQLKQTRLKLVITPVVTLRDDRGTTIKAKSLLLSTVLCMQ